MVATIRALVAEERRRRAEGRMDAVIPMRPDHGHALLADLDRPMMPGYPLIGRMRGQRFVCLSGEDRLVRDADPAEAGHEERRHRRKGAADDD
jgi:hypothetical protein